MPQRTNDFQELVTLIQKSLAPQGAKVTSSALVNVRGMRDAREIDVLIESAIGPYQMKIAVEAKDHRRKMDNVQFESLIGKYLVEGGVKVNQVVVINSAGFYKPVIDRAQQLNIKLLTLSEAKVTNWESFGHPFFGIKAMPSIKDFVLAPPIPSIDIDRVANEGVMICSHGRKIGRLRDAAASYFISQTLRGRRKEMESYANAADTGIGSTSCELQLVPDHPHVIRIDEVDYPVTSIRFLVDFADAKPLKTDFEFRFQSPPHVCKIATRPEVPIGVASELRKEGRVVCQCCGRDCGTLDKSTANAMKKILNQPDAIKQLNDQLQKSPDGQAWLEAEHLFERPMSIRLGENDYPVDVISILIHAVSARAKLDCKQYGLASLDGGEQLFSHFHAVAGGKKFTMIVPHGDSETPSKIVVNVENATPHQHKNLDDKRSHGSI